jgi:hypothetical protein
MSNNAAAYEMMDRMLNKLRSIPGLAKESAPDIAKALKVEISKNISAQQDPYGHKWREGEDGGPVLKGALKAVDVRAVGSVIIIDLTGPEVMHHLGSAKGYKGGSSKQGGFRRPIIPFTKLPGPMRQVTGKVLEQHWNKLMGGTK